VTPQPGFAIVDVETTGFKPTVDRIVELGIVLADADGNFQSDWEMRFNPQGPVGATHVHGIKDEDVREAPLFADVAPEIARQLSSRTLVAHNARFDTSFLQAEFERAGWDMPSVQAICTLDASSYYLPDLLRRRLVDCCEAIGWDLDDAHSALADAHAVRGLLHWYLDPSIEPAPLAEHSRLPWQSLEVHWPVSPSREPSPAPIRRTSKSHGGSEAVKFSGELIEVLRNAEIHESFLATGISGEQAYVELLLVALGDGLLTVGEGAGLSELASKFDIDAEARSMIHIAIVLWLARAAMADGIVARVEREDMRTIATILDLPDKVVALAIKTVKEEANEDLSEGLPPLPGDWEFGDPLRVGDRVCFSSGPFDMSLVHLEDRAREAGCVVGATVTKKTAMLITRGEFHGRKFEASKAYGIRIVLPEDFEVLLAHVQPCISREDRAFVDGVASPAAAISDHEAQGQEVRQWAITNGFDVGKRGRLPRSVLEAYLASRISEGQL
jgi:DNA polymerase-3 subunit epsilon